MELTITPTNELRELIRDCIKSEMQNFTHPQPQEEENYITENEVREILDVSKVTLKKWRDDGKLKFYRFGSRIRYKRSELLNVPQKFGRSDG